MLVYIDESGYPQPQDGNVWSTLTAICTPEKSSRELSRRLHAKVREVYPKVQADGYELKASVVLNRRQYEHMADKRKLVAEVTELLDTLPATVFSIMVRRPTHVPNWPKTQLDPRHRLLIERVELHMRKHYPDELAMLVFDETAASSDAARSRAIRKFMHQTKEGACLRHVVDVPFFVSSAITPGIQLADLLAGALRHYHTLRDEAGFKPRTQWEKAVDRLAEVARKRSETFKVGEEEFQGLYAMPARHCMFPPPSREF